MSSLIGKRIGGQTYYYLREVARVGGRPKIVSQRYLGKADDIAAAMDGVTVLPERTRHLAFGDVAAAWSVIERLGVTQIIDEVTGSRRADAAAGAGTYLALATLNRVVAPCSKLAFADWWATTAADRWVKVPPRALDHRRFWDAMDLLSVPQLAEIERRIGQAVTGEFGLDLSGLVLDMTNFATFIDSANEEAPIAQRGKAKQKRHDLRLVGLALVVTRDGGIPVVSRAYPGNRPDVTQFTAVIDELVTRYQGLGRGAGELTVTFDAGNDSAANQDHLAGLGLHYVASLPPSQHPHLLAIPAARYQLVDPDRFGGLTTTEAAAEALGAERRVILTHSPTFHARQARSFDQTLAKAERQLSVLATRLARGHTRRPRSQVEAEIATIMSPRWVCLVLQVTLTGDRPAGLRLSWHIDGQARQVLEEEYFGKRILFTDRDDWPAAEVISAYRSQADAEAGFRQLKDRARGLVLPDVPLDRAEDPGARLLLRARPGHRPPDAPPGRPRPDSTCPSANCCTPWPVSKKPS